MRLRRHVGTRIDARDARTYRGGISHPSCTFRLRYIRRRLAHSRPIHRRRSRSRLLLDVLGQLHLIQPGDRSPRHPKSHPFRRVRLPKRAVTICRSRARFGYQELRQPWQRISREAARDAACRRRPRRHEKSAAATPARHSRPHHTAPPAPPHWSHPTPPPTPPSRPPTIPPPPSPPSLRRPHVRRPRLSRRRRLSRHQHLRRQPRSPWPHQRPRCRRPRLHPRASPRRLAPSLIPSSTLSAPFCALFPPLPPLFSLLKVACIKRAARSAVPHDWHEI